MTYEHAMGRLLLALGAFIMAYACVNLWDLFHRSRLLRFRAPKLPFDGDRVIIDKRTGLITQRSARGSYPVKFYFMCEREECSGEAWPHYVLATGWAGSVAEGDVLSKESLVRAAKEEFLRTGGRRRLVIMEAKVVYEPRVVGCEERG